ncbi:MAG: AraC family transcriptional regulator [Paenibacillaceae bacterium]|nr:AraC family transcriptional regulator [Paenibacillaceae bacterium]
MEELDHEYVELWCRVPSALEKAGGIYIFRIGRNVAKPHYAVANRKVPNYILNFILEGELKLAVGQEEVVLRAGDAYCIHPQDTYSTIIHRPKLTLRTFWIVFNGDQAKHLLHQVGMNFGACYQRKVVSDKLFVLLDQIMAMRGSQSSWQSISLLAKFYELFEQLAAQHSSTIELRDSTSWLQKCIDYIDMHFREKITVRQIADHVGVDRSHLTRMFGKQIRQTPHQYIRGLKLAEARHMIRRTNLNVTEIAEFLGYVNPDSFTRAYTHYFGYPPTNERHIP